MTAPAREVWGKKAAFYEEVALKLEGEKTNTKKMLPCPVQERQAKIQRVQEQFICANQSPALSPKDIAFLKNRGAFNEWERLTSAKERVETLLREKKRGQFLI